MKSLKKIICCISLLFPLSVLAVTDEPINAIAMQSYEKAQAQMPELFKALNQNPVMAAPKKTKNPMVFISLGMPDDVLKTILRQAKVLQMPVVIRGLYQNSLEKTLKKVMSLMPTEMNQKNQEGVLINPVWFKEYRIDKVPAVVVPYEKEYDIIFGNIPLSEALALIKKHREGDIFA